MAVKNCFIRGSVVRYVQLPSEHVDTQLLEDATRRGALISSRDAPTRMFCSQNRWLQSSGDVPFGLSYISPHSAGCNIIEQVRSIVVLLSPMSHNIPLDDRPSHDVQKLLQFFIVQYLLAARP